MNVCIMYVCMRAYMRDLGERRGYTTYAQAQSFPSTTTVVSEPTHSYQGGISGNVLPFPPLCRCNRLRCPLARMSGLQCFNMGHNGHGINLYGVSMTLMGN